jgi:hypothetical protein
MTQRVLKYQKSAQQTENQVYQLHINIFNFKYLIL